MRGEDFYSGAALSGAASGAASGAMLGSQIYPGWGTAIGGIGGGLLGGLGGAFANSARADAVNSQKQNVDQLIKNLHAWSQNRYQRHISDLEKTLSFYGPAQTQWDKLYSTGGAAPKVGQGSWANTGVF